MPVAAAGTDAEEPMQLERRRSSLASSAASLHSKLAALKLNVAKGKAPKDSRRKSGDGVAQGTSKDPSRPAAYLLLNLPPELAWQILRHLDLHSVFALRHVSVSFASLVSLHQYDIARNYFTQANHRARIARTNEPPYNLMSLYQASRTNAIVADLAGSLADFIELEILRLSSRRSRLAFSSNRSRLISKMTPHLLTLNHFYTTWRLWMLRNYPKDRENDWKCYRSPEAPPDLVNSHSNLSDQNHDYAARYSIEDKGPNEYAKLLMRQTYGLKQLCDANQMNHFVNRVLQRMTRAPTYVSTVEKTLRGWGGTPRRIKYVGSILAIGGLDEARKVLAFKSLSERWAEVERWAISLQKADCVKWKENWRDMVHGPCAHVDTEETAFEPPENFLPYGFCNVWDRPADQVLTEAYAQHTVILKSDRLLISEMLGLDILAGTTWQDDSILDRLMNEEQYASVDMSRQGEEDIAQASDG